MQLGIDIGGTTINLGLVDQAAVVRKEVIPSWDDVHLKEELEARFRIPVFVNNDANCFAFKLSST